MLPSPIMRKPGVGNRGRQQPGTACGIASEWLLLLWLHELKMSEVVLTAIMQRVNGIIA